MCMLWLMLLACSSGDPSPLDSGLLPALTEGAAEDSVAAALDQLSEGYACEHVFSYSSFDQGHTTSTVRLGVSGVGAEADEATDRFEAAVEDHTVLLVEGSCVWAPGCTDNLVASCNQELDRRWLGTAGTIVLERTATGMKGTVTDLVLAEADVDLRPRDGGAAVSVPLLELPERAYWTE